MTADEMAIQAALKKDGKRRHKAHLLKDPGQAAAYTATAGDVIDLTSKGDLQAFVDEIIEADSFQRGAGDVAIWNQAGHLVGVIQDRGERREPRFVRIARIVKLGKRKT